MPHARLVAPAPLVALILTALLAACGGGEEGPDAQPTAADPQRRQALATQAIPNPAVGFWSSVYSLPLVPTAAANLPDGKVLLWSAEEKFSFGGGAGRTYFATFDPATGTSTERTVSETGHNMFCPGTTNLPDGRLLVNGGISAARTSLFDPATGAWTSSGNMNIPRGYQSNTLLADGRVLTLGGSWSGGVGGKHAEVWSPSGSWSRLTGVPVDPFLVAEAGQTFPMDSHMMLTPAANGKVFHAGPGQSMHWIDPTGNGKVTNAGLRSDDGFSISGTIVMYDAGKLLKVGGSPQYHNSYANANSYVIDVDNGARVRKINPMAYSRAYHNSVVLPSGQVMVIGGQTYAIGFTDGNSVLTPELWDPATERFTPLAPMQVPRNYHSVALLLPDARVLSSGGGLCGAGCAANHPDVQVYTPHYLLNADGTPATRPVIQNAPARWAYGQTVEITTDTPVTSLALVRASSTTHTVNNDQRRLPLAFRDLGGGRYAVDVPRHPGLALAGDWMLFAMNDAGVPSVARIVRVVLDGAPTIAPTDDVASAVGTTALVQPTVTAPAGTTLRVAASNLPPGIGVDAATGRMTGQASAAGTWRVTLLATASGGANGDVTVASDFLWTVNAAPQYQPRYVRLEALGEINNNPWSSAAEINILGANGQPLPRAGWTASADSEETMTRASNVLDGLTNTIWHTTWVNGNAPLPHQITIDMKQPQIVTGLRLLPRQDTYPNGVITSYRVRLSADGVNWGNPVSAGDLARLGAEREEKTIYFSNVALGKTASQSSTYAGTTPAARAVDGNTDSNYGGGSMAVTNADANAWWEVDLGYSHALAAIRVWNRTDCCSNRLAGARILVSDAPMTGRSYADLMADAMVWKVAPAEIGGAVTTVPAAGARGRYVRVQLPGNNYMQLAEVEVFGQRADNQPPVVLAPAITSVEQNQPAQLPVATSDPDGDSVGLTAGGLPPGLSLATTGQGGWQITGTPSVAGSYDVTLMAADGRGGNGVARFTLTVTPGRAQWNNGVQAPIVTAGATAQWDGTPNTSGSYSYRWDYGDGSTSDWSSNPLGSHAYANPGLYWVTLTARDADGRISVLTFWQAVQGVTGQAGRSSGTLALSGGRLWVVNPDNNSVAVLDTAMQARIAEIAVGQRPRTLTVAPDGRIWVANQDSASISIINPTSLSVVQTVALPRASQPFGVVATPSGSVYVSLSAVGEVMRLAANGSIQARASVMPDVRQMALNAAGTDLLVSRFVTAPQPGEATASVGTSGGGEVRVLDAATLALRRSVRLQHSSAPDTTVSGRGVPNYLGAPVIAPSGQYAWVPSKQDNILRGRQRDGRDLNFENTVRAATSRLTLDGRTSDDLAARIDHDNASLASAAAFHPTGTYLFVTLETSRQVAVIDPVISREVFRVDTGFAPQGVAVSADGLKLYVQNFMGRTVGIYDLHPLVHQGQSRMPLLSTTSSVVTEALAANVLRGKQLFYDARDPRLARDGYMSCATCHEGGGADGRTWDMAHAGEGLRNTIALVGHAGQGRLHWTGNFDEVQDFEGQIRNFSLGTGLMSNADFFAGTRSQPLGTAKAGVSADLDALAAYVNSLTTAAPSPLRNADGTLTASAQAGRSVFAERCVACHSGTAFSNSAGGTLANVGTIKPTSGQRLGGTLTGLDVPTLRDVWATAPYLHDGSAASVADAITAHTDVSLTGTQLSQVADYVRQIGREETAAPGGTGLFAEYFVGEGLAGTPVLTRTEAVNFSWGYGSPGTNVPVDRFSARWSGTVQADISGNHLFETLSDDGVRLWVNGQLLIDNWTLHGPTTNTSPAIYLAAGQRVSIKVEYFESYGGTAMQLLWRKPGATASEVVPASALYPFGAGLIGQYFAGETLAGTPLLTRSETVDFNWGTGSPGGNVPIDVFSARWTGTVVAQAAGNYTFETGSDDGVRLWIDDRLVVDNWTLHGYTVDTSPVMTLAAGQRVKVKVEYFERTGGAAMRLLWRRPGATASEAVPAFALFN